jgi:hypothetical protein
MRKPEAVVRSLAAALGQHGMDGAMHMHVKPTA